MSGEEQFCPDCGVSNDLHDGPDTCEYAGRKADTLAMMERAFGLRR